MKLTRILLPALAVAALFSATSCSDDDEQKISKVEISTIEYNSDDVWSDWDKNVNLSLGDFTFSHVWTVWSPGNGTSQGFVASKNTDLGIYNPMYEHQFTAITAGGVSGKGTPYLVANWDSTEDSMTPVEARSCLISKADGSTFTPASICITNNTYAYYSMLNGDAYAKKFEKGDKLSLIIHGVAANNVEKTVIVNLANCGENPEEGILKTWEKVDLSPLGTVKYIYFTMSSTDISQWGMNTPAYFAADELTLID